MGGGQTGRRSRIERVSWGGYRFGEAARTNENRVPVASDESRLRSDPMARNSRRAMDNPIPLPEKKWPSSGLVDRRLKGWKR